MHLVNGLAAPCMGGGAWVGARCWLGGRGRVLFTLACDVIIRWLPYEMDSCSSHPLMMSQVQVTQNI